MNSPSSGTESSEYGSEYGPVPDSDSDSECSEEVRAQRRNQENIRQARDDETATTAYYQEGAHEPLNLTLGVEIECILLQNLQKVPLKSTIPFQDLAEAYDALHTALSTPLKGQCAICGREQNFSLPLNEPGVGDLPTDAQDYNKWTIIHDISVKADDMEKEFAGKFRSPEGVDLIKAHSIEIISRVLRASPRTVADGAEHECELSYEHEIKSVYQRLEHAFMNFTTDTDKLAWRLLDNKSCGLHVHIGNGEGKRLPLQALRNATMMYIANERAIDGMHPVPRINGSTLITNPQLGSATLPRDQWLTEKEHCLPWSAQFALTSFENRIGSTEFADETRAHSAPDAAAGFPPIPKRECFPNSRFEADSVLKQDARQTNILAWTDITKTATDLRDLVALHGERGKQNVMNLDNMRPRLSSVRMKAPKNTIEFRQAGGTLDHVSTNHWIDFLLKLINYSHQNSTTTIATKCASIFRDKDYTTLDFLHETLGYSRQSALFKHYKSVLGLHKHDQDHSYAQVLRLEDQTRAAAREADGFHDMIAWNANQNYEDRKPDAVRAFIHKKFMAGCYGQFEQDFIQNVGHPEDWELPVAKFRRELAIGWGPHTFGSFLLASHQLILSTLRFFHHDDEAPVPETFEVSERS